MIVTNALYAEIDRLKAENKKLTIKTSNSLANNLCPDHRDKQAGKPCLACEIDRLRARVKELEDWIFKDYCARCPERAGCKDK